MHDAQALRRAPTWDPGAPRRPCQWLGRVRFYHVASPEHFRNLKARPRYGAVPAPDAPRRGSDCTGPLRRRHAPPTAGHVRRRDNGRQYPVIQVMLVTRPKSRTMISSQAKDKRSRANRARCRDSRQRTRESRSWSYGWFIRPGFGEPMVPLGRFRSMSILPGHRSSLRL